MRRERMLIVAALALVLVIGLLAIINLLAGNEKFDKQEAQTYMTLEEMKNKKIDEAFKRVIDNSDREIEIVLDQNELNEMLSLVIKEYEQEQGSLKINGYKAEVIGDKLRIGIDSYVYKLLPAQYIFEIVPSIENNRISLFVASAKLGRLPLASEAILKKLKMAEESDYYVDIQKRSIVINNKYPDQIVLKSVEMDEDKLKIEVALSITTIKDLINVLGVILPEDLSMLMDKMPVDEIEEIAEKVIRETALAQISDISASIKVEAVKSLSDYAKNNIKLDKLKGIMSKEKVDALIKKAGEVITETCNEQKAEQENNDKDETTLRESIKKTLTDGVKKQLEKQDEDSKLEIFKKLFDNGGE